MVSVMVGLAVGGRVTWRVNGTGEGGRVAVAMATTGVFVSARRMAGSCALMVGRGEGVMLLVAVGARGTNAGVALPPAPISHRSVATSAMTSIAVMAKPAKLAGTNRRAMSVTRPKTAVQAK